MNTLVLHLERSNDGAVVHDYVAGEPWQDGSIFGRFMNLSEETLKPFVEPSKLDFIQFRAGLVRRTLSKCMSGS